MLRYSANGVLIDVTSKDSRPAASEGSTVVGKDCVIVTSEDSVIANNKQTTIAASNVSRSARSDPLHIGEISGKNCCVCSLVDDKDVFGSRNGSRIFYVRATATLCLIFGITEMGLGSFIADFLSNSRGGAWWSGLVVLFAGVLGWLSTSRRRVILTLVFAIIGVLISIIGCMTEAHFTIFVSSLPPEKSDGYFLSFSLGAGVDGSKADETRSLTACGYQPSAGANALLYGSSEDFNKVGICIKSSYLTQPYGTCFCTTGTGTSCSTYALSISSKNNERTCGDMLTSYPNAVSASAALCVVSAVLALILSIFSCCAVCCRGIKKIDNDNKENFNSRAHAADIIMTPSKTDSV